jgi:hypothetical protein
MRSWKGDFCDTTPENPHQYARGTPSPRAFTAVFSSLTLLQGSEGSVVNHRALVSKQART